MRLCVIVLLVGIIGFVIKWRRKQKKWIGFFRTCIVVAVIAILACWSENRNPLLNNGYLIRGDIGEGSYDVELLLKIDGQKERIFSIEVPEQTLSEKEEQEYLTAALEEIEAELKGENESLEKVKKPITIRNTYQNGLVMAEWSFSEDGIFDETGVVISDELDDNGTVIVGSVLLKCGSSSMEQSYYMVVFGQTKSGEVLLEETIKEMVLKNGDKDGTDKLWLPVEIDGHTLEWTTKKSKLPFQILFLGMLVAFLLPELEKEREKEAKKKREAVLLQEYPEFINKFTLLLGAGMNIQGAWNRITDMYLIARNKKQIPQNELYEEMLITRHEIESGRGEMRSYEAFGERCGLSRYRKFSSYLVQNLRKGSNGFCEILEKEAADVLAEKRNLAKKYGEEATTKLLFPMLLMLGIVIFIIMVPAVISFQAGV